MCKHIGIPDGKYTTQLFIWPFYPNEEKSYPVPRYWKLCPVCGNKIERKKIVKEEV